MYRVDLSLIGLDKIGLIRQVEVEQSFNYGRMGQFSGKVNLLSRRVGQLMSVKSDAAIYPPMFFGDYSKKRIIFLRCRCTSDVLDCEIT